MIVTIACWKIYIYTYTQNIFSNRERRRIGKSCFFVLNRKSFQLFPSLWCMSVMMIMCILTMKYNIYCHDIYVFLCGYYLDKHLDLSLVVLNPVYNLLDNNDMTDQLYYVDNQDKHHQIYVHSFCRVPN